MKRIIVIGSPGSGKSTLARQLSDKLKIEVFHLDQLFWQENWQMTGREYQIESQKKILQKPSFIIDGNYDGTLDLRINAADTILFLDRNRYVCLYQIFKRIRKYRGLTRPDMHSGCPEKFDLSFIKWVWYFPKKNRPIITALLADVPKKKKKLLY